MGFKGRRGQVMAQTPETAAKEASAAQSAADKKLLAAHIERIYQFMPLIVIVEAFAALAIGVEMFANVDRGEVVAWLGVVALGQILRIIVLTWHASSGQHRPPMLWASAIMIVHGATSLAWGLGAALLVPALPAEAQSYVLLCYSSLVMAGIAAGLWPWLQLVSGGGAVIPLAAALFLDGTAELRGMAAVLPLLLLLAFILGFIVRRIAEDLIASAEKAEHLNERLNRYSATDPLTGVSNRPRLLEEGERLLAAVRRAGHPLSVMLVDLDSFKVFNEAYGTDAGDRALVQVADMIRDLLRTADLVGRFGGEEFAGILVGAPGAGAYEVAERLRQRIESRPVVVREERVPITVSIGVAESHIRDFDLGDLLRRADAALVSAKLAGRNRVVLADPPPADILRVDAGPAENAKP